MTQHLALVPTPVAEQPIGGAAETAAQEDSSWVHKSWCPPNARPSSQSDHHAQPGLLADERGAVTAEYAIIIMAAVAFAGLLVAIMSSSEIRAMLVGLVESALSSAG